MARLLRYHPAMMVRFYAKTLKPLQAWFLRIWWQQLVSLRTVLAWSLGLWLTVHGAALSERLLGMLR